MNNKETKVWLINGYSQDFGHILAEKLLQNGDRLVATSNKPEELNELLVKYPNNVFAVRSKTRHQKASITTAIQQGEARFGHIDVFINNVAS